MNWYVTAHRPVVERIDLAAWKDPRTGKVYTGQDHYECWANAYDDDPPQDQDTPVSVWAEMLMKKIGDDAFFSGEGFVTTSGRFVDRDEALIIAKRNGQIGQTTTNGLRAEEVNWYKKANTGWQPVNPRTISSLRRIRQTSAREQTIRDVDDLLDRIDNYHEMIQNTPEDHEPIMMAQQNIHYYAVNLGLSAQAMPFVTREELQRIEQSEQQKLQAEKERMKRCTIKVLELDQFTATAENIGWYSMQQFDPDILFGGDATAAKDMFGGYYQIKFVCEDENPSKGTVWLKDGSDGKLAIWKANYDSSD